MLSIFIVIIIGLICGIITGITPGLHVNLVATTTLTLSPFLVKHTSPLSLGAGIISLAVTHSFIDTIPSTYLGAPENEHALSILPAQKLLLGGKGFEAVYRTITGTYGGLLLAILLTPVFLITAPFIKEVLTPHLPYILLGLILFLLIRDTLIGVVIFFLSGSLGLVTFRLGLAQPLFPLLSGLFGLSGLIISLNENTKIPPQLNTIPKINFRSLINPLLGSTLGVFIIQFFPGLGPSQGAVLSNQILPIHDTDYLSLIGALGTMSVVFSLITFYTLGSAKDGSIVVLSELIEITPRTFLVLLCVLLVAGSFATVITLKLSRICSSFLQKIPYRALILTTISFIVVMCLALNGWKGFIVLFTSTAVGLIAPITGANRSHAMGCLLLPVLISYFV